MSRTTAHPGSTKLKSNDKIEIVYDAEVKDVGCVQKLGYCCCGCKSFDRERSYLYVRENSLETNVALKCICCGDNNAWKTENVQVLYFDKAPFKPAAPKCCFVIPLVCCKTAPKLDVSECGCWICCQRIVICEAVVIMPFEQFPFPCCCCSNRNSHGLCNLWACFKLNGPLDGTPKKADSFMPQPRDPWEFVKAFGEAANMSVREKPGQDTMPMTVGKASAKE